MDLESLRSFYHVARERSFSRAAKTLHVSQPAVSVRIKSLERELNERLFDRARRGVALTEAGTVLFASAEKIFSDVALEAAARASAQIKKREAELVDEFKKKGIGVHTVNRQSFVDAVLKTKSVESMGFDKKDYDRIVAIK